jgi:hypothetical protein
MPDASDSSEQPNSPPEGQPRVGGLARRFLRGVKEVVDLIIDFLGIYNPQG